MKNRLEWITNVVQYMISDSMDTDQKLQIIGMIDGMLKAYDDILLDEFDLESLQYTKRALETKHQEYIYGSSDKFEYIFETHTKYAARFIETILEHIEEK